MSCRFSCGRKGSIYCHTDACMATGTNTRSIAACTLPTAVERERREPFSRCSAEGVCCISHVHHLRPVGCFGLALSLTGSGSFGLALSLTGTRGPDYGKFRHNSGWQTRLPVLLGYCRCCLGRTCAYKLSQGMHCVLRPEVLLQEGCGNSVP